MDSKVSCINIYSTSCLCSQWTVVEDIDTYHPGPSKNPHITYGIGNSHSAAIVSCAPTCALNSFMMLSSVLTIHSSPTVNDSAQS